jgi:hypothetical protein
MQDGKAIKMLATASRLDIEDFLQKKVYLEVIASAFFLLFWRCSCELSSPFCNFYGVVGNSNAFVSCSDRCQSEGKLAAR